MITQARYIDLEEWNRDWAPLLEKLIGDIEKGACTNLNILSFEVADQIPDFRDPGWELVVLSGTNFEESFYQSYDMAGAPEWYNPFGNRDEFTGFFKTMELLGLSEMVVCHDRFWPLPGKDPAKIAQLYPATRQGVSQSDMRVLGQEFCAFDRSLRWGMVSGFEDQTALFGDAEFMNTFYEASGGKQAVIDRLMAYVMSDEWEDDRPTKGQQLFKNLGWDFNPEPHLNSKEYQIWKKVEADHEEEFDWEPFRDSDCDSPEYQQAEIDFYQKMVARYGPPNVK